MSEDAQQVATLARRALLEASATRALVDSGCRFTRLALPHIEERLRVSEDGDLVYAVDQDGQPRYGRTGRLMTAREVAEELKATPPFSQCWTGRITR